MNVQKIYEKPNRGGRLTIMVIRLADTLLCVHFRRRSDSLGMCDALCRMRSLYDQDDDVDALISKTLWEFAGSGLFIPDTANLGIPGSKEVLSYAQDHNLPIADDLELGAVAFTPYLMSNMKSCCESLATLDLGGPFCKESLLDKGVLTCLGRSDLVYQYAIVSEGIEDVYSTFPTIKQLDNAEPLPDAFVKPLAKCNAMEILREIESVLGEDSIFKHDGAYWKYKES